MNLWFLFLVFAASTFGTWLLRRYALARSVLDIPNDRSSHVVPTPRGGGLAIVVAFLVATLILAITGEIPRNVANALLGAGSIVAVAGFLDDHRHVPARWRLLSHFVAAGWALWWLGGLAPLELFGRTVNPGWVGAVVAAIALVWLLNLYNFMDGIDGIAGVEAVTVCAGAAAIAAPAGMSSPDVILPCVLAAAALGFLVWNFPRARIFMGDAGSGFLGMTLGVLAVHAAHSSSSWMWSWIILLGAFVVDATVTLLRRLGRREKVYQAHRSHAYQHAALRRGAHWPVTTAVAVLNLFWLLPLALLVGTNRLDGATGVLIAYLPLIWLAFRLRAGVPAGARL